MIYKNQVEGTVVFSRSDKPNTCICCEGNHIYGKHIEFEPFKSVFPGLNVTSVQDFIPHVGRRPPLLQVGDE